MKFKYTKPLTITLLLGLFFLTRIWKLASLPFGIHIDEAGMAYDAWCLAEYGVDRHLKSWPLYLQNFGSGQSSLYAFLCAGLFKIFGYHPVLIRIPGVLSSLVTLIFGTKLALKLNRDFYKSMFLGLLITICPYFIMASRIGLDCNLMLGVSTAFLWLFAHALETGRPRYYVLAGIVGGLVLYTYALSYIVLPLFLLFVLIYVAWTRKFSWQGWLAMAIPMGILAAPLMAIQCINMFDLPEMKLGFFTLTKLGTYRISELGMFKWQNFTDLLHIIFTGDTLTYNSVPQYHNLYVISNILFIPGLISMIIKTVRSVKHRDFDNHTLPFLWFVSFLLFAGHTTMTSVNKANGIFFVTILIALEGLLFICGLCKKYSKIIITCICGIYALCFLFFARYYFMGSYTAETYPLSYFEIDAEEAFKLIEENEDFQDDITYFTGDKIYYALFTRISPYELMIDEIEGATFRNYWFSALGAIEDGYNYIVRDGFEEYCNQLRDAGFAEIRYNHYSFFYKE
ncbi:MAG: glycosyltransferase family 39 protein [Lachnospiraceae bacterium]|nr:glycosyltransferase family 39 protein [Lachnospiraceae bacterium]